MKAENLYFIALLPPEAIRKEITLFKEFFRERYNVKHALKSPPHITLFPPFKWPAEKEPVMVKELIEFAHSRTNFRLELKNFGAFKPRVIFVDILKNDHLDLLYTHLNDFLKKKFNLSQENKNARPYNPHITIAFKDLNKKQFHDAWPLYENKELHFVFDVKKICLLKHNGKYWDILVEFPLTEVNS